MKFNFICLALAASLSLAGISSLFAQAAPTNLKSDIQALEKQLRDLKRKVEEFEPPGAAAWPTNAPLSLVIYRNAFVDNQQAAPRTDDLTLDPQYRGFIPVPHTPALLRINARPRVDFILDTGDPGNADYFLPAAIPVEGDPAKGGGARFNVTAKASRLSLDVRAPTLAGSPRFYFENDFFGAGSANLNFNVRHLYGQYHNLILGQTYSAFEDADAWPDTLDYEGPNGMVSLRQPQLQYQLPLDRQWRLSASVEKPASQVDGGADSTVQPDNHAPDIGFNARWAEAACGHVQLAAVFRVLGAESATNGNQTAAGGGLSLSAVKSLFARDSLQAQSLLGRGIGRYLNDNISNNDAAYDAAGDLQALPCLAAVLGYTHYWTEVWRSTASYGFVQINNAEAQGPDAYHRTHYASLNLMWQPYPRLTMGLEGLYGRKETHSGAAGADWRVQAGIIYSLF